MKKREVIKYLILRTIGNFFVLFTIFGFFATFGPALYYEASYRAGQVAGVRFSLADITDTSPLGKILEEERERAATRSGTLSRESEDSQQGFLGAILSGKREHTLIPKSTDFSIIIPKIGASERVFANTDPSNEREYLEVLGRGIAHAKGSGFPGLNGNIYLFAHSADNFWNVGRYNAAFYLIKELANGDGITVFFNGKRYNYIVSDKKIIDPEEVGYIDASIGQGETLILQTCWPPGTTWKRLLVFAKPK